MGDIHLSNVMESPSAKVSVLILSEKKLKQATLPFEIMKMNSKTESPLLKRQKLNNFKEVQHDDDSIEIIQETLVNGEKQNVLVGDSSQFEVEEASSGTISGVINNSPNYEIVTDEVNREESNSSDVILSKKFGDESVNKNISKPLDEIKNVDDDNLKCNKRKLENAEMRREPKQPKRAKLIYNIDKINVNERPSVCNVNSVNADCSNKSRIEEPISRGCSEISLGARAVVWNSELCERKSDLHGKCYLNDLEEANKGTDQSVVVKESSENSNGVNSTFSKESGSSKLDETNIDNMDVDSVSLVVLLTPGKSCEKPCEENCTNPSFKSENSPNARTTKQLTPKQLERKAEIAKRKEEIQQEKERKRKEKDKMKQEKEEEKARLKLEKEEVKKKMKEEKEKKRLAEIEMKNEEKRRKEEEKRKKEEEKLEEKRKKEEQKQEDKRKKEEMLKKKEEEQEIQKKKITKEAEAFSSFFKKYDSKTPTVREDNRSFNEVVFMPFAVRADMRLAPVNRNPMDDERHWKFEELFNIQSAEVTYLMELRSGAVVPKKSDNTWPLEEKYGEVVILDEGLDLKDEVTAGPKKKFNDRRPKLLQFHENRRPPYWGTWRKKSKNIRPKNPLGKDEVFDYEVDSDDEWEEEEPGESLHGSDDEKESEDEYEVDNDFLVPHGYLSDDENPEEEIVSPETQKAKLKLLGEQFDLERNEKTKLLKPILLGCIWFNSDNDEPASANPSVVRFLSKRKAVPWTENVPIPVLQDENTDPAEAILPDNIIPTSNKETVFPESAIPDLITLIYGSTNSRKNLAKTFHTQWIKKQEDSVGESEISTGMLSQARIARKIKELARWEEFPEEGPFNGKLCWYVKKEVREKFGLSDLSILQKFDDISDAKDLDACKKISPSLITKFTKVLTEDERRNQITKARKSLSVPKLITECSPNIPKQVTTPKCIEKLKEFWAKPSVTSKYTATVAVDTHEVMIVDSSAEKEDSGFILQKTAVPMSAERKVAEGDKIEDFEMVEIKGNIADPTTTHKVVSTESSKDETHPTPNDHINEEVVDGCSGYEGRRSSNLNSKHPEADSKPAVKKRVAILFSAPRGCEIIKPEVDPNKPAVSMDDAQK